MILFVVIGIIIGFTNLSDRQLPWTGPTATSLVTLGLALLPPLIALALTLTLKNRLPFEYSERLSFLKRYRRWHMLHRGITLGTFALAVHYFRWPEVVNTSWGLSGWVLLDELLVILPFLVELVLSWAAFYPLENRLRGRAWTLSGYLLFQVRHSLAIVLLPWFLLVTTFDIASVTLGELIEQEYAQWTLAGVLALTIYVFAPFGLRLIWRTTKLPVGDLRSRLEDLCQRARLRFREILVWHTGGGRIANAGITGIIGRFRFVLLTDVLLVNLSPEEIEAVFAHEVGHVRHGHMLFYLVFAVGFAFFSWSAADMCGRLDGFSSSAGDALLMAALVVYWGLGFGFLSRRLERQADIYAARLIGSVDVFTNALEGIAMLNGIGRSTRSWRHFSIAKRVEFLRRLEQNPDAARGFDRTLRLSMIAFFLLIGLCVAWTVWNVAR